MNHKATRGTKGGKLSLRFSVAGQNGYRELDDRKDLQVIRLRFLSPSFSA